MLEEKGADLFFGIKRFIDDYNYHRRYQGTAERPGRKGRRP